MLHLIKEGFRSSTFGRWWIGPISTQEGLEHSSMDQKDLGPILSELGGFRFLTSAKKALDMLPRIKRPRDLISLIKGACDSLLLLTRVLDLTQLTNGASYIPPLCKRTSEPHLRAYMASNMPPLTKLVSEYFTLLKQASNILSLNEKTTNLFPRGLLEFLSQRGP